MVIERKIEWLLGHGGPPGKDNVRASIGKEPETPWSFTEIAAGFHR